MTLTSSSIAAPELGLRERKRLATSRNIQYAVLELSRDKGFDSVTIDEISRRADISPRTFFNYFPSKEAAVLGESPFSLPSQAIDEFLAAGPDVSIFDGILAIMQAMSAIDDNDFGLHQLRKLVMRDYPHLLVQRISSLRDFEVELTDLVEKRLASDARATAPAKETPDHPRLSERARLIALVSIAAMRHAWGTWAGSTEAQSMPALLTRSFRELETLL